VPKNTCKDHQDNLRDLIALAISIMSAVLIETRMGRDGRGQYTGRHRVSARAYIQGRGPIDVEMLKCYSCGCHMFVSRDHLLGTTSGSHRWNLARFY
jgi:hypothetical protein